ncbi:MAG: CBS domain-containing protein [Alphaproteobacteria bacterium]|nr:CBS domain-containing protein [Alphaproteobacteria bacterium]
MTVAAILKHKGNAVTSVRPDDTLAVLAVVLAERRIGAVVVLGTEGALLGVASERDIVAALAAHGASALDMAVSDLMTRTVSTVALGTTVAQAMALMTEGRFRHLPVMAGDRVIGIVSIGDVVKARIMAQEGEVESLRAYVAGG